MKSVVSGEKTIACDGNRAAAWGVRMCHPDIIAAYPITPQTQLLETLAEWCSDGSLDAEMVAVEGEISSMGVMIGASLAGARTFTSTASEGLEFMFQAFVRASTSRLPIVMGIATREPSVPDAVANSLQDIALVRDAGWILVNVESCQEILDSIIMAYRLAESPEILLPVAICYEGFYLSYLVDKVIVPSQENVDAFLAPLKDQERLRLSTDHPMAFGRGTPFTLFSEARYKHSAALGRTKRKIDEIDREFQSFFGRGYGGLIEEYQMEDAEIVLVSTGAITGTAREIIDSKRDGGLKVGLVKLRVLRPFPRERLAKSLAGKKAIGVIERDICFDWGCGTFFMELKAALSDLGVRIPMASFIDGLGNLDVPPDHIERAVDIVSAASQGKAYDETTWLSLE